MGHYTEVHCRLKLRKDLPLNIVALFTRVMIHGDLGTPYSDCWSDDEVFKPEIDNEFFLAPRWYMLLQGTFIRTNTGSYTLTLDAEYKNYDQELEKFLNWIAPYISTRKRMKYIGWWSHESMDGRQSIHLFEGHMSMWHRSKRELIASSVLKRYSAS